MTMEKKQSVIGIGEALFDVLPEGSNPKVQDFVFGVVDNLLTKYPDIAPSYFTHNIHFLVCQLVFPAHGYIRQLPVP